MPRPLSSATSLDVLRKEARRWLKAILGGDHAARQRLFRAHANAPDAPTLRDVQHALAAEYGCLDWTALKRRVADLQVGRTESPREQAVVRLLMSAADGDAARVAAALDEWPDIVNERGTLEGHTGLRTALHFGIEHEPVVRVLLDRGADPNVRDQGDNAYPLHFAAERGDLPVMRLLVEHGAATVAGEDDDHHLDIIGWATCFESASKDPEVARYLLAHGARHTILSATAAGDTDAIRTIAARSRDAVERVMDRTNHRRRPLHLAVVKKQPAALLALLELGAGPDAADAAGLTPLDQAALAGELEMARVLLEHRATIGLPAAVCLRRHDDVARLLQREPGALAPGGRWETLIVRAASRTSGEVIDTLVAQGASVNVIDSLDTAVDGTPNYTALHAAAWTGNLDAASALLRHGANPRVRDGRYHGTPAGWAARANRTACRDLILSSSRIDIFDAISLNRADRIAAVLENDPKALHRPFGEYETASWSAEAPWSPQGDMTPLEWATWTCKADAVRELTRHGAEFGGHGRQSDTPEARVAAFLRSACLDWGIGGPARPAHTYAAGRLLARHPEIARANLFTAAACGVVDQVTRLLRTYASAANPVGGPRQWPPLLYVCTMRLPEEGHWSENAVAMATALLDAGADPNAFYQGGSADIHYTALACAIGRGEEQAPSHPKARELAALLLERGAEPYDMQLLYNAFGWHAGHRMLRDDDLLWLLELIYDHAVRRGRLRDWQEPEWKMLSMGGYGCGAWYFLYSALKGNNLLLAEWALSHGAGANPPRASDTRMPPGTLYEQAVRGGQHEFAALLARYGAGPAPAMELSEVEQFTAACFRLDRSAAETLALSHPELLADPAPLVAAAERNRSDVAALLLDLGMPPDTEDPRSRATALHAAAYHDALDVIALLIARGAEVDPHDGNYGGTPIGWAQFGRRARAVDLLARHSGDLPVLVGAGKVDRLTQLLADASPPPATGHENDSLLFYLPDDEQAAAAIVRLLLARGIDPSIRRPDGSTAERVARARGLHEAADLLKASERG